VSDHRNRRIDVVLTPLPDAADFQIETVRGSRWERVLPDGVYGGAMLEVYAWRRKPDPAREGLAEDSTWEQYQVACYQPGSWHHVVFNASLG
jgi:hypothetical protein